jgi:hypothetical protein
MKRQIWIDTLQWFIGIYIAIRGTLMLMVPHTLNTHVFVPIQPHLPGLGAWQVIAGAILIAAVTLVPRRSIVLFAHLLAGSALLQAASGHLLAGTWTAFADFVSLGFGTAIAPFLQTRHSRNSRNGIDLFALLMSIRMVLDGIIVLIPFNPQFDARLYDPVRPYLLPYGIAYLVSGLALLAAILGSVAKILSDKRTRLVRTALSNQSKDFINEFHLRHTVPLTDSLHLSLTNHIHCFNSSIATG